MAKLNEKYQLAQQALRTFRDIFGESFSPVTRDAAIQRFEYTFEICWKTLQTYLKEKEGIIANSPKSVFREALSATILKADEVELALEMTDDRNLTTHTYHEAIAQQIYKKLPDYCKLFDTLLSRINQKN